MPLSRARPCCQSAHLVWATAGVALLAALAARIPYFVRSDFPLNDGGLFVAMSRDLLAAHFVLPMFTTYNSGDIPFAYPPLGFYVTAAVTAITGLDAIALARWLPLLTNLATVVCVVPLALSLTRPLTAARMAPIVFALLPRSYQWLIMGGGLTRSIGYLFAVACVWQAARLAQSPGLRRAAVCAALAALALAAHLEEGLFALYSLGLVLVCLRGIRGVATSAVIGVAAALLTAPWWGTVVAQHGIGPFQAASLTSGWSSAGTLISALGQFLAPPSLPLALLGSLAVLGAGVCLVRREPLLPIWLLAVFVLTPRSAPSEAVLPQALLASVAIADLLLPRLTGVLNETVSGLSSGSSSVVADYVGWLRTHSGRLLTTAVALVVLNGAVYRFWPRLPLEPFALESLTPAERGAMAELRGQIKPGERVLVLSATESWEEDMAGEWFPVLASGQSVLTPQGTEWLPDQLHARKVCLFQKVREVAPWGISELDTWASERGIIFSDIYISRVPRGPIDWGAMVNSAASSPEYEVLLNTPDAAVLRRRTPIAARWAESGEFVTATDCASLADQPAATVASFDGAFGPLAAAAWVRQHQQAIPDRPSLTRLLGGTVSLLPGITYR
ncbi:MAG: hypothetical protein JOZ81_31955 [Chloroflexi bacterium]|nr:hypothetical protein [Chloroflexota bacterium]